MDNTQLIKELKDCISLHLNPYNLGDMGKTVQLITEACNRLQNDGKPIVSGSLLSFEQCLREEFLVNTQNYPKEYHQLFKQKFERAEKRFKDQSGNNR